MQKNRIRELRAQKHLSLRDVSEKLGVSLATVQRYEAEGGIKNIPLDNIKKYADILGVSPAYLVGWTDAAESVSTDSMGKNAQEEHAPTTEKLIKKLLDIPESERGDLICMLDSLTNTYLNLKKYTR